MKKMVLKSVVEVIEEKYKRLHELMTIMRRLESRRGRRAKGFAHYWQDVSREMWLLNRQIEVLKRIYFRKESI